MTRSHSRSGKPIWPKSPPKFVAAALSGHSPLGLALGALMFIVCLSGTLAVFAPDAERWEQADKPEFETATAASVQHLAQQMLVRKETPPANIFVYLPTEERPRLMAFSTGKPVIADEHGGMLGERKADFTRFLLDLHIYLHLPSSFGIAFVGMLGAMLVGLIISGLLAHPRIFKDAFTFRLGGAKRLSEADLHNRLSVWGTPFYLVIALTGALIGMSMVMATFMAALSYNGDTTKVFNPIFGGDKVSGDRAPAPLIDVAKPMETFARDFPQMTPLFVRIIQPGTAGQSIEIKATHPDRLVDGELYRFDSAGEFAGTAEIATGALGVQLFNASYQLHFGSFGGGWIRLAYGAMGIALCVITATGVNIWLMKRREKRRPAPRLERAWVGVVWGSPLSLAVTLAVATAGIPPEDLVPVFWSLLAAIIAGCIAAKRPRLISRVLRVATSGVIIVALAIRGGAHGPALFSPGGLPVTLGLAAIAVAMMVSARGLFDMRKRAAVYSAAE